MNDNFSFRDLKNTQAETARIQEHYASHLKCQSKDRILHSDPERWMLYELAARLHDTTPVDGYILQCGTYRAGTACILASASDLPVITIDNFSYARPAETKNHVFVDHKNMIDSLHLQDKIISIFHDSVNCIRQIWRLPIRLAIIDTNHKYEETLSEIEAISHHFNWNGGRMLFHDYRTENPTGVNQAVDEYLSHFNSPTHTFSTSFCRSFFIAHFQKQEQMTTRFPL